MNSDLIAHLLNRTEGSCLDFKRCFPDWKDSGQKAAFLKDILAFSNRYEESPAYIVYGIDAGQSPSKHNVVGIDPSNLPDEAKIQQYVNSKLKTPVRFNLVIESYDNLELAVIVIEDNHFPTYSIKSVDHIEPNAIYYRSGSSNAIMDPSQFHDRAMRGSTVKGEYINVRFSIDGKRTNLEHGPVPNFRPRGPEYTIALRNHNVDYFRDHLSYIAGQMAFLKVVPIVSNDHVKSAYDLKIKITLHVGVDVEVVNDLPSEPSEYEYLGFNIRPHWQVDNPVITANEDVYDIVYKYDCIHPSESENLPPFYILFPHGWSDIKIISQIYAKDMADTFVGVYVYDEAAEATLNVDKLIRR